MIEKVKYIFELNYLINYDEQKQLEIIDNSINYIHTLFEKKSNLNLEIIKELELAFSLSDLEKRIIEEEQILLNEESKYYSQMIEFRKFINIFYYDVVNEDNCLKIFIDFYCNIIMFTATVITLRKIKNNKTERVIKDINSYLSNKQTKYEYFFIELKKRLNLYNKNITLSIVELIYKQLMNEQLDSDTELNKMHHRFNINKKTLSISKNQISNEMTFNEKLASFHNILIKK